MSKPAISHLIISRRILIRTVIAVVALFLLALIPGAVGTTFWVAFMLGALVLIGLTAVSLIQSTRARTR